MTAAVIRRVKLQRPATIPATEAMVNAGFDIHEKAGSFLIMQGTQSLALAFF